MNPSIVTEEVLIRCEAAALKADLAVPRGARGLIAFAHGSGSGRFSPRNREVARALNAAGLATLLVDLLTQEEESVDEATAAYRFDIRLLTGRLLSCAYWHDRDARVRRLPLGYFGASTGAAAALGAAAEQPEGVFAVVSRGGRPDLASDRLGAVKAPTLLIVGGIDHTVLELNREAAERIKAECELVIVPGAGHLFEEPGALEKAASLAAGWFVGHLAALKSGPGA